MQISARVHQPSVPRHPVGARVMLLTLSPEGRTVQRLLDFGCLVDCGADLPDTVTQLARDPLGYDLFVMDCDGFGGIPAAEAAIAALIAAEARMRVMLISREFDEPAYPLGRRSAVSLPEDASDREFRLGFEHVLRDRVSQTMM